MNRDELSGEVQIIDGSGAVKARVDVRIRFPGGSLTIFGFSVIAKDGKPVWVAFPSKMGKIPGKYFPVADADGDVRKLICDVVLEAYQKAKAA